MRKWMDKEQKKGRKWGTPAPREMAGSKGMMAHSISV